MAIRRLGSSERDYVRNRFIITNAIVGQMLPTAVVKGGSALKMRYGDSGTRATTDLDIAVSKDVGTFEGELETRLQEGWEGFTGKLKKLQKANPQGIPSEYVMQPYEIKLLYLNVHETASKNTSVAKSADDAVRFANDLICEIANTNCDSTAPEAELRQLGELAGPANGDRKENRPLCKRT